MCTSWVAGTIRAGNMRAPNTKRRQTLAAGSKNGHGYLLTELPGNGNVAVIVYLVTLTECPGRLCKRLPCGATPYVHVQGNVHAVVIGFRGFLIEFRDGTKTFDEVARDAAAHYSSASSPSGAGPWPNLLSNAWGNWVARRHFTRSATTGGPRNKICEHCVRAEDALRSANGTRPCNVRCSRFQR